MRFAHRLALGPFVVLGVLSFAPSPSYASAEDLCKVSQDGWNIIVEASSDGAGEQFLCNYRVDRSKVTLADGSTKNLEGSGVAVTIEYFCTAEEARERYDGVAGQRDTETYRDDKEGVLISEEGPQAKNPDNPQSDGVYSQFFTNPDGSPLLIGLMEKEWRLLNPQVFATMVVLTNERGAVDETERFGVESAEVVARELAEAHREAVGCAIPSVATGGGSGRTGGGGKVPVGILAGGGVVLVGGVVVWTRRPGKKPKPKGNAAAGAPPECAGVASEHDRQVDEFNTLREAEHDLGEKLTRAERIHNNNLIKARIVVNIEIVSVIGGTATDLAVALRPIALRRPGPGAVGQMDTWKKGKAISPALAARLHAVEQAARAAWNKMHTIASTVETLLGPIEERVRNLPGVKNAQQLWDFHLNRLGEMIADLPKANAARAKITELGAGVEALAHQVRAAELPLKDIERAISGAETELNYARNKLPPGFHNAVNDLDEAKAFVSKLARGNEENTAILARAQDRLEAAQDRMQSVNQSARDALDEIGKLEQKLAGAQSKLGPAQQRLEAITKQHNDLLSQKQATFNKLMTGLNDVTPAMIDEQGKTAGRAQQELDAAAAAGRAELSKELNAARAARDQAELEAASAQGLFDDLRAQAEVEGLRGAAQAPGEGSVMSAIGRAIHWASTPIRYSLTIAGEIVFGVGQSPKEIVDILLQGRTNVQLLRENLGSIRRAAYDKQRLVNATRRQLDLCRQGVVPPSVGPSGGPLPPPAANPVKKAS